MLIFPFYSTLGNLVNAICLNDISLKKLDCACELLAVLTTVDFNSFQPVMLTQKFLPLRKSFQYQIEAEQDQRLAEQEHRLRELEKEQGKRIRELENIVLEHKKEIAKLKSRYLPVSVDISRLTN